MKEIRDNRKMTRWVQSEPQECQTMNSTGKEFKRKQLFTVQAARRYWLAED